MTEFILPPLGENIETAEVVKILVSQGATITKNQPVVELETGKAVLELPSTVEGIVKEIKIKVGDTVRVGDCLFLVSENKVVQQRERTAKIPAGPRARRLAREGGVDLAQVNGSGPHGLIMAEDVHSVGARHAKPVPIIDFSKWGPVERIPLSHIRKQTALNMARSWSTIPHVTQHDWADITELDKLRVQFQKRAESAGGKLTLTVIILKVVASALKVFPKFNASLDWDKGEVVQKKYIHVGVAVDTERGLLVPVVRDADQKNILQLSVELTELAEKARNKTVKLEEMQGGSFSITNLGGIGGTLHFSPLINAPEVAVLGVGRSLIQPAWISDKWQPRKMMPLSLSYDHRLIDGADAARFLKWVADALTQPFLIDLEG